MRLTHFFLIALIALLALLRAAQAQGSCGAAGGAPTGPSFSVCDFAREAAGLMPEGPALGAGNPIDLATGNKSRNEIDLRVQAWVPMVFARHYNSRNRHSGMLGAGWSHSFETRLAAIRTGGRSEVQIIQGDGRRIVFEPDPARSGRFRHAHVSQGLVELKPGTPSQAQHWLWRWPGGRALRFDTNGRLQAILRDGEPVMHLGYDARGKLIAISASRDGSLSFEYEDTAHGNRLVRVLGAQAAVAHYTYDSTGQLSSVTWPDNRGHRFEYEDPSDPLLLTRVLRIDPTSDRESNQGAIEIARYTYDTQGRAIRSAQTDTNESIDVSYVARQQGSRPGVTAVTDEQDRRAVSRWTYDRHRHLARILHSEGNPCSSCPPAGRTYTWHSSGLLAEVDATLNSVRERLQLDYDAQGRPIAAWHSASPSKGRARTATRTLLWRLAYDSTDPLAWPARMDQPSIAPGQWHRLRISFDALGRPLAISEHGFRPSPGAARFQAQSRQFDLTHRGRQSTGRVADWLSGLSGVNGPLPGNADRIGMTQIGELLSLTHPSGLTERLTIRDGLLEEHIPVHGDGVRTLRNAPQEQWLGGPTLMSAYSGPAQINLNYDRFGSLQSVTREHFERRSVERIDAGDSSSREAADSSHRALSFWRGRPTVIELPDGALFKRGFDDFGRVVWIDEPDRPRQWADYDPADRLIAHWPGDGSVLRYTRDDAGRLTESRREFKGTSTLLGRYQWQGAALVQATNDAVDIRYSWDRLGRLVAAEHRFAHSTHAALRYEWQYDLASRITTEVLPGNLRVNYHYDGRDIKRVQIEAAQRPATHIDVGSLRSARALRSFDLHAPEAGRIVHEGGRLTQAAGVGHMIDPHGRRAAKYALADPLHTKLGFVHQDWRLRTEHLPDGQLRHWVWAHERPVALIESDQVLQLATDARGAPVQALSREGKVVWSAHYNVKGAAAVDPGSTIDVPLRLPGQYADAETGWHANHWRTYSPFTGRYLESDPLGLQPDYVGRRSLTDYAGGDPIGSVDPWGLARLTWYALTTDAQGKPLGRTQGFDRARWSFMIEDILPVPLTGSGAYPPATAGIQGILFDPWGDFVRGADAPATAFGNAVDTLSWNGATGRQVFASFAAHYGGALASPQRFIVDGFDDRRAGALALILSASPSQRKVCVGRALSDLPALSLGPAEPLVQPARIDPGGAPRVLECQSSTSLPVAYRDDIERSRVERYQAAAELQESPSASINENCALSTGCRTRARIDVNGHSYWASYGRTQFTVTTFLGELSRLTQPSGAADASALRAALQLDTAVTLNGRQATLGDALELARRRVEASYRAFAAVRTEFGRGLSAAQATQHWTALSPARRDAFTASTGLGQEGFVDMLGYVASGVGGRTEEEGRHALAASAAASVRYTTASAAALAGGAPGATQSFDQWLVNLYSSKDPYDHVSRVFLRDNLRRVLNAPTLAGRFTNQSVPDSPGWYTRQADIERDLAKRVGVLHNSGRFDLATSIHLDPWLTSNPNNWIAGYVHQFTIADARGNWEALRCTTGLAGRAGMQFTTLSAMPEPLPLTPGILRK